MTTLIQQLSPAIDSALCCLALGAAVPSHRSRVAVAMLFGVCDLAASLLALAPLPLSVQPPHFIAMPPAALYFGFAMLVGLGARAYPRLAWAAPVLLSLDNLFAPGSIADALADGASSAALAAAALYAGAWFSLPRTRRFARVTKSNRSFPAT